MYLLCLNILQLIAIMFATVAPVMGEKFDYVDMSNNYD